MAEVSGSAVQARDVHGGIHFHGAEAAASRLPRQLPADVRCFVNRGGELEALSAVPNAQSENGGSALHLIVGTAGVGKTALALHWAHRVRERYPDGQLYADLRGFGPGPAVPSEQALDRLLRALGVPPEAVPSDLESRAAQYRSLLAGRRVLVLLDNAASSSQVRPLLPGTSGCAVIVTSRDRLSGLVAREGGRRITLDALPLDDAVDLLETLAAPYRPPADVEEVAELARLCVRLPLALRIAAERAASRPGMPLGDLIGDLRDESGLWDALAVDNEEEADAVRSVFAWSYRTLPEQPARLFRLLGLHPSPDFGVFAAAALVGEEPRHIRRLLDLLAGAHLLEQHGRDRYRFHDLLRSYAVDQARHEEPPETRSACLKRLTRWYVHAAHAAVAAMDPHLPHLPIPDAGEAEVPHFADRRAGLHWYDSERTNLAAVARAAAEAGDHEAVWRLVVALRHALIFHSPVEEWTALTRIGLDSAQKAGSISGEADLLETLGMACVQQRKIDEALNLHSRALELRHGVNNAFGAAMSLNSLGLALLHARRIPEAREHFEQCLDQFRALADRRWEGIALTNLAAVAQEEDEQAAALELAVASLDLHWQCGNELSAFAALATASECLRALGRTPEALPYAEQALSVARDAENPIGEAYALVELGKVQVASGTAEEGLTSFHHAATVHRRIGDKAGEATALEEAGRAYEAAGRPQEAEAFRRGAAAQQRFQGSSE